MSSELLPSRNAPVDLLIFHSVLHTYTRHTRGGLYIPSVEVFNLSSTLRETIARSHQRSHRIPMSPSTLEVSYKRTTPVRRFSNRMRLGLMCLTRPSRCVCDNTMNARRETAGGNSIFIEHSICYFISATASHRVLRFLPPGYKRRTENRYSPPPGLHEEAGYCRQ